MLKPTKDKELRQEILFKLYDLTETNKEHQIVLDEILQIMEKLGYHVGLPENIEWALNSGDGSYHP